MNKRGKVKPSEARAEYCSKQSCADCPFYANFISDSCAGKWMDANTVLKVKK